MIFYYPENLKATASLWLWSLRDFVIVAVSALLSAVCLVQFKLLLPAAITLCFAFLTIRMEDTTILDFIIHAVRYFIPGQQFYIWREYEKE